METEVSKGVEIIYTDSALLKIKIKAPLVKTTRNATPTMEMPKGAIAYAYNERQEVQTSMKANYAMRNINDKILEARGNVVLTNVNGDTLTTNQLFWEETKDRIYTDQFVRIATPKYIIFGNGLESNSTFTKYKILKVTGKISASF